LVRRGAPWLGIAGKHDAGLIRSSPQKVLADGTDRRFLDEPKRELKA
jgi:hypothetical protein